MRRSTWIIAILSVMWCAWWAIASAGLQQALNSWVEDRRELGWTAEIGAISKHGFPLSLHAQLNKVTVADSGTGVGLDMPQLDLIAAAYWPGFMSVKLPEAPFRVTFPTGTLDLQLNSAQADLRLHPGATLQLQGISLMSGVWRASLDQSLALSADTLQFAVIQDDMTLETYKLNVDALNLTPGNLIRTVLALPQDWPGSFEIFSADVWVTFDRPWDRTTFDGPSPQPRAITLRQIAAEWGLLEVSATGDLNIDPMGIPTGTVSVKVSNWRDIVDLVEASGALPSAQRQKAEIVLSALANLGGNSADLILDMSFQNGQMSLGPINLGAAPRFALP